MLICAWVVLFEYFPKSPMAAKFVVYDLQAQAKKESLKGHYKNALQELKGITTLSFADFAKNGTKKTRSLEKQLHRVRTPVFENLFDPAFWRYDLKEITRSDILKFRSQIMQPRHWACVIDRFCQSRVNASSYDLV